MPQIRKLTPEEVEAIHTKPKGQRRLVEEEYDALLSEYEAGDYGEASLDPEEKRLTVQNRLRAAAKRRNIGITFRRASGDLIRFQIVADSTPTPVEPPAPVKRKGGRPKKTA